MSASPQIVVLHGTGGSPEVNWLPWLASELKARNISVAVPQFPVGDQQSFKNWSNAFSEQIGDLSGKMVLVGHSMGVGMILRLLQDSSVAIKAAFLVAGWTGLLNDPDFDPLIESFFRDPFDWSVLQRNGGQIVMYHGDNDPYVPLSMGKELASRLAAELKVIPAGGHLNAEAGFTEFDLLLDDVLSCTVQ